MIVWAVLLLLTWRVWRLEGIWVGDEVKEADEISSGLSKINDHSLQISQHEPPQMKNSLDEQVLVQDSSPKDSIPSQD